MQLPNYRLTVTQKHKQGGGTGGKCRPGPRAARFKQLGRPNVRPAIEKRILIQLQGGARILRDRYKVAVLAAVDGHSSNNARPLLDYQLL